MSINLLSVIADLKKLTYKSHIYYFNKDSMERSNVIDVTKFTANNIRNICILAHVDHGKTSVADNLLSLNGVVSKRSVGSIRYLDDRPDEQERHITMKSSVVSLVDTIQENNKSIPVVLNLVDTPGHIDFSTEVTAAVRICDGALIVVDVVEGVCAQTKVAIKQAYDEKLKMILIINKIDRLVIDLKQDSTAMFHSILRVVEDCNVYLSSLYHLDISVQENDEEYCEKPDILFSPEVGNVIFASAIDGWGFTICQIANLYSSLIKNETEESLTKHLWNFDCFVSAKDKELKYGAIQKGKPNLFIQMVTNLIEYIYSSIVVRQRTDNIPEIISKLKLKKVPAYELYRDPRLKLKIICEQWQPLNKTIMEQCVAILPSPCAMTDKRIHYLINYEKYFACLELREYVNNTIDAFKACSKQGALIAYISKMLVIKKNLGLDSGTAIIYPKARSTVKPQYESKVEEDISQLIDNDLESDVDVIAVVRIFSGTITIGQELYLLNSTYDPSQALLVGDSYLENNESVKKVTIEKIFVLLGRDYHSVNSMSAGYICGVSGIKDNNLRTATLCSFLFTPPIIEQCAMEPIVYNVISPVYPNELNQLRDALRLVQLSDSCVKVILNESGEYLLVTAGDVHLQKCLEDLKNKFSSIEFSVSPPIYPLRETIEHYTEEKIIKNISCASDECNICIEIEARPLPEEVVELIKSQYSLLKIIEGQQMPSAVDVRVRHESKDLRNPTEKNFQSEFSRNIIARLNLRLMDSFRKNDMWSDVKANNLWRISNSKDCLNLLINCVSDYTCNLFTTPNEYDSRIFIDNYIVNAFNMSCNSGPLCGEPLMNCAFIVKTLTLTGDCNKLIGLDAQQAHTLTQQFRGCFRDALLKQNVVLMEPMLATYIQTDVSRMGE